MTLSRRAALTCGAAMAAVLAGGFYLLRPVGFIDRGRRTLAEAFGDLASGPVTDAFLQDAAAYIRRESARPSSLTLYHMDAAFGLPQGVAPEIWIDAFLVHRFAMSTNVVAAAETGAALEYAGFFDPHALPCANQLSAVFAPV